MHAVWGSELNGNKAAFLFNMVRSFFFGILSGMIFQWSPFVAGVSVNFDYFNGLSGSFTLVDFNFRVRVHVPENCLIASTNEPTYSYVRGQRTRNSVYTSHA